jgi:hypothetical protein
MAEENKSMDELLKAYAKKREAEAGTPFEMHPATRKMLEGEVQRTFPKNAAGNPRRNWMAIFWPRFAMGAALCALAVGLLLYLNPGSEKTMQLAGNQKTPAFNESRVTASKSESVKTFDSESLADKPVASAPAIAGRVTGLAEHPNDEAKKLFKRELALAEKDKSLDLATKKSSYVVAPESTALSASSGVRQEFANSLEGKLLFENVDGAVRHDRPVSHDILTSFEFQIVSGKLRVVDSDGSIYDGKIVRVTNLLARGGAVTATESEKLKADSNRALSDLDSQSPLQMQFEVTGTNITLNKLVTFSGGLFTDTSIRLAQERGEEPFPGSGKTAQNKPAPARKGETKQESGVVLNRIDGRASLGTNQIEVRALRVQAK